jgi:hypothetical protein
MPHVATCPARKTTQLTFTLPPGVVSLDTARNRRKNRR